MGCIFLSVVFLASEEFTRSFYLNELNWKDMFRKEKEEVKILHRSLF